MAPEPNERIEISLEDLDEPSANATRAISPAPFQPSTPPPGAASALPNLPAKTEPKSVYVGSSDPPLPPGAPASGVHYHQHAYVPVQQSTNGLAIASLVLSILWLYWLGSILAVIFGHVARAQIRRSGGTQGGDGLAIAGLVMGWIGVGTLVFLLVVAGGLAGSS